MIKIRHGLITKPNRLYTKNTAFEKFCCDRSNGFIKRQLNILQNSLITNKRFFELEKNASYPSVLSRKPFSNRL